MKDSYLTEINHTLKLLGSNPSDYDKDLNTMPESEIVDFYNTLNSEFYEIYN